MGKGQKADGSLCYWPCVKKHAPCEIPSGCSSLTTAPVHCLSSAVTAEIGPAPELWCELACSTLRAVTALMESCWQVVSSVKAMPTPRCLELYGWMCPELLCKSLHLLLLPLSLFLPLMWLQALGSQSGILHILHWLAQHDKGIWLWASGCFERMIQLKEWKPIGSSFIP